MSQGKDFCLHAIDCDLDEDCRCAPVATLATAPEVCRGCGARHAVEVPLEARAFGARLATQRRRECEARLRGWYTGSVDDA
jgi:hypothetical protein